MFLRQSKYLQIIFFFNSQKKYEMKSFFVEYEKNEVFGKI